MLPKLHSGMLEAEIPLGGPGRALTVNEHRKLAEAGVACSERHIVVRASVHTPRFGAPLRTDRAAARPSRTPRCERRVDPRDPTMKRFHLHLHVYDLDSNVRFFSSLLGTAPALREPDRARWVLEDPRLLFSISADGSGPGAEAPGHRGRYRAGARRSARAVRGGRQLGERRAVADPGRSRRASALADRSAGHSLGGPPRVRRGGCAARRWLGRRSRRGPASPSAAGRARAAPRAPAPTARSRMKAVCRSST